MQEKCEMQRTKKSHQTFRIDTKLLAAARLIAENQYMSLSEFICDAIRRRVQDSNVPQPPQNESLTTDLTRNV